MKLNYKAIKTIFLFILLILNFSCISDEESRIQTNSLFQGEWSGTFSGEDSGNINFIVKKEGTIYGTITTAHTDVPEDFIGYVSFDGKFDINTRSKFYFTGFLNNVKEVEGQWEKIFDGGTLSGKYIIKKQ